ncbi:MAG TPA: hypothetical protein DD614_01400 [Clostridiales bacterium]|nr:hypothetical protein [Clostridiales bacterium]
MGGLKTLCKMQLKDRINLSFLKSVKQTIFKVVLSLLKFALITAVIYFGFYILSYLRLVSLLPGVPENLFEVIFTCLMLLSIIVCSFGLVKTLYFAKDNFMLLTMPVDRTKVFLSKLIVFYIYEFIRNLNYFLPLLVAYGLINKMPFYYFFWLVLAMFIITLIPVCIGALLSIPLMYIQNFIKSYKFLEYTLVVVLIAGVSVGLILVINSIPANFDLIGTWGTTFWNIQNFLNTFNKIFMPFTWMSIAIVGKRYGISNNLFRLEQWISILIILGGIAIIFGLTYLLVRPMYFHMASTPFEYKKDKVTKTIPNKKQNAFWSGVVKDFKLNFRTPSKFYSLVAVIIGLPTSIFLLNKIYSAMDTRLTGTNMSIAFNILLILLIALSSNTMLAHVYSEEGNARYQLKTNPKPQMNSLVSKLVINVIGMTLSILITVIIFASFLKINVLNTILIFVFIESLYLGHMLHSVELDIMNPQTQRYQTEGDNLSNPNDIKSVIFAFLISIIFAFITYFLISENMNIVWTKVMLVAVVYMLIRTWLFVNKVKVYYKEVG